MKKETIDNKVPQKDLQMFRYIVNKLNIKEKDVITPKEMEVIDNNCEYLGIPKILLMENAGRAVYEELLKILNSNEKIYVFCGTGNNGGDGFVVARHLSKCYDVSLILLGRSENIKTYESRENFKILKNISEFGDLTIEEVILPNDILDIIERIEQNTKKGEVIVIDAMLGTGVKGELREPFKTAVTELNRIKKEFKESLKIVSVDVETGDLNADKVVTFHKRKTILRKSEIFESSRLRKPSVFESSRNSNDDNLVVKSIGIPKSAEFIVGTGDFKTLIKRGSDSHKGENGKVLVVGGSKEFFGAPILSALAASKMADLVTVASVRNVMDALKNYPELMGYELEGDYVGEEHIDEILSVSKKYDCIVLGSGLGVNNRTKEFVNSFLKKTDKKVVIDADAIKVIDYSNFEFKDNFIFTPHKGEFEYMKEYIEQNTFNSTIVLKGRYDIIFNRHKIKINKTGNPGMTVGGTGDVLCGIIGALFAKNEPFVSSCCGAFINGYCGDLMLKKKGYYYTSMDIIDNIPKVLKLFG
jgi:NAD(P)H-hydrate epimerase